MKSKPIILALSTLAFVVPTMADTFTLKDGTTLEGVILKEDSESYLLEVQVTKSIKDERTVAKADVAKVVRERPDQTAFEEIAKLVPTPDLLTDEQYGERITAVNKFLKAFPDSSKKSDAEKILATLKEESSQVASGGVKMKGKIITPEEYQLDAYDLDAKVEEARILNMIEQRQFISALRAFSDFMTNFKSTNSMATLTPVMTRVMNAQIAESKRLLASLDQRTKERETGLQQMAASDRRITENALKDEAANVEKRLEAEKAAKILWVTPSPFSRSALDEAIRGGESELRRLGTIKAPDLSKDSGGQWREAMALIVKGSPDSEVSTAIAAVRSAAVPAEYITILETAAKSNSSE